MFTLPTELGGHLQRGGTLIVPDRARVRAVRLAHAAAQLTGGHHAWNSADVLTPAGWLRRETERAAAAAPAQWPRLLAAAEEWYLWRQCAAEAARGHALLDSARLGDALRRAAGLALDYNITLREIPGDAEASLLAGAQRLFAARCRELHAASAESLARALIERARSGGRAPWLAGFALVPPPLAGLEQPAVGAARAPAHALRPPGAREELEAIAAWCAQALRRSPAARLRVMLPGPAGARERLAALVREALDPAALLGPQPHAPGLAGLEEGVALTARPAIAHALCTLRLLSGEELPFEELLGWLRAPHWHSPAAGARAALAHALRERPVGALDLRALQGALQLAPPRLRSAAHDLDNRLRLGSGQLGGAAASPRTWAERWTAALRAVGLAGGARADEESQHTLLRWHELLEEFGDLGACLGRPGGRQALSLLAEFAHRSTCPPVETDPCVTIAADLADPVVQYDGIWVAGLSAQVLPQPVQPDAFLPLAAQRAAGVPQASAALRAAEAAHLLACWRHSAAQLVLSVPAMAQDLDLLPSPLLETLAPLPGGAAHRWLPGALRREAMIETLEDRCGDPWDLAHTVPGGTRAVTLQSQCPFRAYAELRLGSVPPQELVPGIAMDQRGRLLHSALQILWERLGDSDALGALSPGQLERRIAEAVAEAARTLLAVQAGRRRRGRRTAESQFDLFVQLPPVLERECRRAQRLIGRLCALEREREPFRVAGTELEADLRVAGAHLRMRLDRVDQLPQGRVILDYKSGKPEPPDWYGERPTHPQLLAYLTALGEDVVALATVHITPREVCFSGLAAQEQLLPTVKPPRSGDWPAQATGWRELIERLIRAFIAGDAEVDPAPRACAHCHVTDICRILERSVPPDSALQGNDDE
ncbi:MAG: PD-(D/E)XK nuclease family protein [Proteobacteria bacterium]|nr:PD-(D/E)XK nuclease family protein [Pseudomonadota bacterium]